MIKLLPKYACSQRGQSKITSQNEYKEAYVWIWLPNETEPVVAGLLTEIGNQLAFNYGRSYLTPGKHHRDLRP